MNNNIAVATAGTFAILVASAADAQMPVMANGRPDIRAQAMTTQAVLRAQWAERVRLGQAPATGTEPSLTGGRVLTPSVDVTKAPGLPELQLAFNTGTVGIANLQVELSSPSGSHNFFANIVLPSYPPPSGKLVISALLAPEAVMSGFGLYAEPGTWTVSAVELFSQDGQFIYYGGSQIAALFTGPASVDVVNPGTPDTTQPVAGHGAILTPTVSLSNAQPYAAVKLSATDNLSGVSYGGVGFSLAENPSTTFSLSGQFDAPKPKGTLVLSYLLPSAQTTGQYSISSYFVCDYAANCLYDNTPAGIAAHFDRTVIKVTQ